MTPLQENEQFAARLRALKERAGLSFETLARQTGISRSSLHRYCAGGKLPADYGIAHAIGRACGASKEEFRELHRLWAIADSARSGAGTPAADGAERPGADGTPEDGEAGEPEGGGAGEQGEGPGGQDGHAGSDASGARERQHGGQAAGRELPEVTDVPVPPRPSLFRRRLRTHRVAFGVIAVAAAGLVTAAGIALFGSDDGGAKHPAKGGALSSTVSVHVFNVEKACRGSDHLPACSIGLAKNPRKKYDADNVVTHRVWHNDVLVADCVLYEGTMVADETGVTSSRWLRVRLNDAPGGHAWLSAVRTHDSPALPTCKE
ncbi:helix-turn-helix domain-containing protein [Streptomyces sp. NPDC050560]|uniref:helix-turn-helix domain-containing protein n=1 Tax=Streptomyces sp. NPDC050560 TaxID=3365630 RepID=UPI0037A9D77B